MRNYLEISRNIPPYHNYTLFYKGFLYRNFFSKVTTCGVVCVTISISMHLKRENKESKTFKFLSLKLGLVIFAAQLLSLVREALFLSRFL